MKLADALDVRAGDVVAIVGGGGKTTALFRLGDELAGQGLSVLVSGTTRFTPPEGGEPANLVLVEDAAALEVAVAGRPMLTAATGWGNKGRLQPIEPAWVDALHRRRLDLAIVLEADGSAMRPFKAPNEREPVIPDTATIVVCVVGMDVVGRPLDERSVHRPERVAAITGAPLGAPVTVEMIAAVLLHPEGGRKGTPAGARWFALLNKADAPARLEAAEAVSRLLTAKGAGAVVAHLRREPPVLSVVRPAAGDGGGPEAAGGTVRR